MTGTATRTRASERASTPVRREDAPPLDPLAVSRNYRLFRARRRAREQRERQKRWAAVRFWIVLALVVGAAAFLALRTMGEIERVFGL
jgi:anti-sigma-K factor RskA